MRNASNGRFRRQPLYPMSTFHLLLVQPKIDRMNIPANTVKKPKLLDRLRHKIRMKHYSIRTEEAYVDWARRYILFHCKRHPKDMRAREIEAFLTHLAVERTYRPHAKSGA
jgi:hypothetical protein